MYGLYICTCMYVHNYMYDMYYFCMCIYMYTYMYMYMYMNMYTYMYMYMYTNMYTYVYMYMCIYMYMYMYICTCIIYLQEELTILRVQVSSPDNEEIIKLKTLVEEKDKQLKVRLIRQSDFLCVSLYLFISMYLFIYLSIYIIIIYIYLSMYLSIPQELNSKAESKFNKLKLQAKSKISSLTEELEKLKGDQSSGNISQEVWLCEREDTGIGYFYNQQAMSLLLNIIVCISRVFR